MKKVINLPTNPCHCIDFMALVRKVPLKKFDPLVKIFQGFAIALTSVVTKAGHNCEEIRTYHFLTLTEWTASRVKEEESQKK